MQYHRIHEIHRVIKKNIALYYLPFLDLLIIGVLVMIRLIHCLVVVLLCPTSLIYDNRLFFSIIFYFFFLAWLWLLLLLLLLIHYFFIAMIAHLAKFVCHRCWHLELFLILVHNRMNFRAVHFLLFKVCFLTCKRIKSLSPIIGCTTRIIWLSSKISSCIW